MNITPLTIYLWQLADKAQETTRIIAIMAALVCGLCSFASFLTSHEKGDTSIVARQFSKMACFASLLFIAIYTVIPSSKTIAMMVVIPEIAHSKVIQQDLPDIYNAAVDALKNQLKK